jgi:hypothetical protein
LIRAIRDSNGLISNKELIQDVTHRMAAAVVASSSTLNQHPGLYGTKEHGLRLFFGKPRPQPVPQAGLADNSWLWHELSKVPTFLPPNWDRSLSSAMLLGHIVGHEEPINSLAPSIKAPVWHASVTTVRKVPFGAFFANSRIWLSVKKQTVTN